MWLVGMMGAGKTAVGRALAERLACPFVDTDAEVVARSGRSIAEIFEQDGQGAFRALERSVIEAIAGEHLVAGLGGGAIAEPGAAEVLAESGTVIYLRAREETLLDRLGECRDRPLLAGLRPAERAARLADLLKARSAAYQTADIVVDTDEISVDEVVTALVREFALDGSE